MENIKKLILYKIPKIPSLLSLLDLIIKSIFIKKTYETYNKIGRPYGIIIDNNILKFHNNDIRRQIKKELVGN